MTLTQAIKRYPKGMIYYHDKEQWVYYKRCLTQEEIDGEIEVNPKLEVAHGEDWSGLVGYAPNIVVELARILGIKVESV